MVAARGIGQLCAQAGLGAGRYLLSWAGGSRCLTSLSDSVTLFNRGVTNPDLFPRVERLRGFRSSDPNDQNFAALSQRRFDVVLDVWPNDPDVVAPAANLLREQ